MISAKLIKDLEKRGFSLDFPSYGSIEEEIIEIMKEKNSRLYLALPILLMERFDYSLIKRKLDKNSLKEFNKILLITNKIFESEGIDNSHLKEIRISLKVDKKEIKYYSDSFKEYLKTSEKSNENILKEQITIRSKLNTNKALAELFAPAKIRIMEKIFSHSALTNTELKYYYKAIRPIIHAVLNEEMKDYLKIIESVKKEK